MDSVLDSSCSCHLGHAPCVFCTETYECAQCEDRCEYEEELQSAFMEELCTSCYWEQKETQTEAVGEALMESIRTLVEK